MKKRGYVVFRKGSLTAMEAASAILVSDLPVYGAWVMDETPEAIRLLREDEMHWIFPSLCRDQSRWYVKGELEILSRVER